MSKIDSLINLAKDEDEKIFINKMIDKIDRSYNNNHVVLTDFLDPGQIYILNFIINTLKKVNIRLNGGYDNAERKRAVFIPLDYYAKEIDFELSVLKLISSKFSRELQHRDYLGSLLGVGIRREMIGDIIISEDNIAYVVTTNKIKEYLLEQFDKVSNEQIKVCVVDKNVLETIKIKLDYQEMNIIVSAMRLDNIIATVFKISRSNASNLINQKKVKINFRLEESIYYNIKEESLISVKGYGRFSVNKIIGKTRKEKILLNLYLFK